MKQHVRLPNRYLFLPIESGGDSSRKPRYLVHLDKFKL